MKMILNEVRTHLSGLYSLGEKVLPTKLGYTISKNIKILENEYKDIEQSRIKNCEAYAEKDSDGKAKIKTVIKDGKEVESYVFKDLETEKEMQEEYKALMESEVDITICTVTPDIFELMGSSERHSTLTVNELRTLAFMVEEK